MNTRRRIKRERNKEILEVTVIENFPKLVLDTESRKSREHRAGQMLPQKAHKTISRPFRAKRVIRDKDRHQLMITVQSFK